MESTAYETLTTLSATELAKMIASGDISSVEAVEAHIERIERVNPALNAVVVKRYDAARSEAKEADARRARGEKLAPLHGVPITIKESLDLAGTPSTFGLPSRAKQKMPLYAPSLLTTKSSGDNPVSQAVARTATGSIQKATSGI